MNRILVTGATGNLGGAVKKALLEKGVKIRSASRNPEKIVKVENEETVKFSYEDKNTYDEALEGIDGIFLIAPPLDFHAREKLIPFIDRAVEKGVKHIVLNTALGVDASDEIPLRIVELHLMKQDVGYTIVRPNFFMDNFTSGFLAPMLEKGGIFLPAADGKTSFISVDDIASVVATAFEKGPKGNAYNLTGPEALDHGEAARIISDVTGKEIAYHAITEEQMKEGAKEMGMSDEPIQYILMLYDAVRKGWMSKVTDTVEKVTGKKPMSFREFVTQKMLVKA